MFLSKLPYPLLCLAAPRMLALPRIGRAWTTLQDRNQLCLVPHAYVPSPPHPGWRPLRRRPGPEDRLRVCDVYLLSLSCLVLEGLLTT